MRIDVKVLEFYSFKLLRIKYMKGQYFFHQYLKLVPSVLKKLFIIDLYT